MQYRLMDEQKYENIIRFIRQMPVQWDFSNTLLKELASLPQKEIEASAPKTKEQPKEAK